MGYLAILLLESYCLLRVGCGSLVLFSCCLPFWCCCGESGVSDAPSEALSIGNLAPVPDPAPELDPIRIRFRVIVVPPLISRDSGLDSPTGAVTPPELPSA